MERTYDIGQGVTVKDNGFNLIATWKEGAGTHSIGVKRPSGLPPVKEGDEVEIQYSVGRKYFYLPRYADPHGFWLGTKAWATREECEAQQKPGIFGKGGCEFSKPSTGEKWYRERLDFAYWKVDAERQIEKRSVDDMVIDYLHFAQMQDRDGEERFNEAIAFTGRNLKWIIGKIGPWVAPEVPATVRLT